MRRRNRAKKAAKKSAEGFRRGKYNYFGEDFELYIQAFTKARKIEGPLRSAIYTLNSPIAEKRKRALRKIKELNDARVLPFLGSFLNTSKHQHFKQLLDTILALGGKKIFIREAKTWFASESIARDYFYEAIAEGKIVDKELVTPLVESWLKDHENWGAFGHALLMNNQAMHRLSLELAKNVSPQAADNLILAGNFFVNRRGLSETQNLAVRMGLAMNKRWLEQLPSSLDDRRQRAKIDFLNNLADQARDLSLREIAEYFKLVKPLKRVD